MVSRFHLEKVVHFLFPVVFFRSALEWFPIQLMKLTFASLLFHSCKEFMLLDQICLWVKHRSRIFGNKWFPVKDTASSAYFVCIIQVKRNPHRNNEKGVLQLTMSMCILIAITTPGIYFFPKGKDYQEADHTYSIGAQPPKKLAFCKRAKKRGGWFSAGNQRQGGFLPHRNIATPSAPVRGLYSQALEERGHIPVKPAPASSQTQRMALFGFAREGRVLSINGLQNESGLQFLGVTTNLASSRQYFCFATLCDDCATSLSFTIKGKVLMKISELRFHKKNWSNIIFHPQLSFYC